MTEDTFTISTGLVDVGDGHSIYYQQWGNPKAPAIFALHGGPGSQSKDKHKLGFDPHSQHVIFHDQRGCGQSTPLGELEANTTQHLVADIVRLREHLSITNKISLFGGSWGSALALFYAIEHPDTVEKMLLSGIYTGTKKETDYIQQGGLATHFPDSYDDYIALVPDENRIDTTAYYFKQMQSNDDETSQKHIATFFANESAAMNIDSDFETNKLRNSQPLDEDTRKSALLEPHYFVNNCFMPDNHILNNAYKLKYIPMVFVQGRFDHICPPVTAYRLAQAIGDNCRLHIVPAAHGSEAAMRETLRAYIWSFLR